MLRRLTLLILALVLIGGAAFWMVTEPRPLAASVVPEVPGDPAKGEVLFWAGGCASCHAAPGSKGDDRLKLAGGEAIASPFGTFHAPNISPDKTNGIGDWSTIDFVNAMKLGLGPQGQHLYPACGFVEVARQVHFARKLQAVTR